MEMTAWNKAAHTRCVAATHCHVVKKTPSLLQTPSCCFDIPTQCHAITIEPNADIPENERTAMDTQIRTVYL